MTPVEVLRKARELISTPKKWTQYTSARDSLGNECDLWGPMAVCWCMTGAVDAVGGRIEAFDLLSSVLEEDLITDFNDDPFRTHAEVLAAFDEAIRRVEVSP